MNFFYSKSLTITDFSIYRCVLPSGTNLIKPRPFHSLSYRLSGSTVITAEKQEYFSKQGDITYVPKKSEYLHSIDSKSEIVVVHFDVLEDIDADIAVISGANINDVDKMFLALFQQWEQYPITGSIQCLKLLYRILSALCTSQEKPELCKSLQMLDASFQYIRLNFADVNLSVKYLAEMTGVSEAYYRRLFEHVMKCSPIKYIKKLRIECAKRLLKTDYYSINDVAMRSGYASASYFSTEFRNEIGMTPHEYARLNTN